MERLKSFPRSVIAIIFLLLFSNVALADMVRVGDWILDTQDDYAETFVTNASGSAFGFFCYDESCIFYVDMKIQCVQDHHYPMLINSDSGATYVVSSCVHIPAKDGTRYVMSISDKDIVTAISTGDAIGFAIPLDGGQFKIVRFSLNGALTATDKAVTDFNRTKASRASRKFRDVTM